MKSTSLQNLSDVVRKALLKGGQILNRGFKQKKQVIFKSALDPVTQVDRAIEKTLIQLIRREFPDHGFIAEESSYLSNNNQPHNFDGYKWIIDPLDGTVNFVHGIPQSCVSVAVAKDGLVLAGGVFDARKGELFFAVKGKGATLNGRPIAVSKEKKMIRSILITGFPYKRTNIIPELMKTLGRALACCADVRRFGSAALDLSWVASGRAEGYWESSLNPWDVAAGALLIQEAGGTITDFSGKPFQIQSSSKITASNGHIHQELTTLLKRSLKPN